MRALSDPYPNAFTYHRGRRIRTEDGTELPATEYFTAMGGYLTPYPTA